MSDWTPKPWLERHDRHATSDLMRALTGGSYDQLLVDVTRLLDKGAHPDGENRDGMPLRLAVNMRLPSIVVDLLAHGADPNARCFDPGIPEAQGKQPWNNCETVLQYAAYRGCFFEQQHSSREHIQCILHLIRAGADIEAKSRFGISCRELVNFESKGLPAVGRALELPLHTAIAIKNSRLCLELLEAGFDPEAKNPRRQTAWRHAELTSPDCYAVMSAWRATKIMRNISRAAAEARP